MPYDARRALLCIRRFRRFDSTVRGNGARHGTWRWHWEVGVGVASRAGISGSVPFFDYEVQRGAEWRVRGTNSPIPSISISCRAHDTHTRAQSILYDGGRREDEVSRRGLKVEEEVEVGGMKDGKSREAPRFPAPLGSGEEWEESCVPAIALFSIPVFQCPGSGSAGSGLAPRHGSTL